MCLAVQDFLDLTHLVSKFLPCLAFHGYVLKAFWCISWLCSSEVVQENKYLLSIDFPV